MEEISIIANKTLGITNPDFNPTADLLQFKIEFENNERASEEIHLEFEQVLKSLADEDQMSKFTIEYQKMYRALNNSMGNIEKLYQQHIILEKEYIQNIDSNHETLKTSLNDQLSISSLKSTITKVQENLQASALREESGVGLSTVQERTLQELHQAKEQTTKELEQELDKIVLLRTKIQDVTEQIKQTDETKRRFEHEIYELKEKNTIKKGDIEGELRNKDRLEKELREIRSIVGAKSQEVRGKQDVVNRCADEISMIDNHIKSQRQMLERLQKDQDNLFQRSIKLKADCGEQIAISSELAEENAQLQKDSKTKTQELAKLHNEVKKLNKIKDTLMKKNKLLEEQKSNLDSKRKECKTENDCYVTEIEKIRRQIEIYKKTMEDFSREKGIIDSNFEKALTSTHSNNMLLVPYKQTRENLELEIARFEREIHIDNKVLKKVNSEKDLYIKEALSLQQKCVEGLQIVKKKELAIYDYKKQMVQADTKLKHQQALYEAVQSDRNLHAKHLVEAQSDIGEMKRKLKIMNYQINGYKEDINGKEEALNRESTENTKLLKDIDLISDETKNLKNQNEIAQAYIKTQLAEELKLNQFVKEAELERSRQENALQALISERDNLCSQLIKQDDQLTKVYGKIKSNTTSLMSSEKQYEKKLAEIRELKNQIRNLNKSKFELKMETSQLTEMNLKLCRMENDVVFEKTRVKALEQELVHPINVHRWRKLEGSNPKAFEMIQLVQALQKKLIEKTNLDNEKVKLIQQNEEIYLNCKTLLSNQVGPEAFEQVREFEKLLKDKQLQLKHMGTELNMYQAQGKEYKHAIEVLNKEIDEQYIAEHYRNKNRGYYDDMTSSSVASSPSPLPILPSINSKKPFPDEFDPPPEDLEMHASEESNDNNFNTEHNEDNNNQNKHDTVNINEDEQMAPNSDQGTTALDEVLKPNAVEDQLEDVSRETTEMQGEEAYAELVDKKEMQSNNSQQDETVAVIKIANLF
ncbi:hypothetical protein HK099_001296 [Clydaea vesicula]|uniref:Cilia- and flagella-associated protein 58 central coiled coil domain-containing protein n=1 Tax=Clydaea vesicula TaxID=447962 RepID=A0AAD5Y1W6_9FUNG|nr:hypothetical protein HK099_001296 [Clydaea vesicula]